VSDIVLPYDWEPRWYQMPLWQYMERGGKRAVFVCHRRGGKDLTAMNWASLACVQRIGLYWHLFPTYAQGKKIAWDGKTKAGRPFTDVFHPDLVMGKNHTEMKISMKNGSIYNVVGADKPDSLVGANPIGVIISEWSLMSPYVWDLLQPILAENGGWVIFVYTPRGKNHGWKTLVAAKKNPNWYCEVYPNSKTKVVPEEAIQEMRESGMPEEMIQQEMECSFEAPLSGSYYGTAISVARKQNRVGKFPWEPKVPVHTAWDLGVGDSTAIWFYQMVHTEIRIIDHYETSGEGLPHYVKVLRDKPYVYGRHYGPHDIAIKEFGTGKTRVETARLLGLKFDVLPQSPIEDGIEAVRSILPRCYFNEPLVERGLSALENYHKEWDEVKMVFKNKPDHDWTSHSADGFRYLAMGQRDKKNKPPVKQDRAISDYDPHRR
jgi:phage terminase large subunit